jgi:Phage capsid protein
MSFTITENMVQQFGSNYRILGQQRAARLTAFCQMEPGIVGTSKSVERLGKSDAYDIVNRHGDTQYVNNPHSRRWLDLQDKGWADLVDEMDKIKLLADPTSPYVSLAVNALNRAKDDAIIAAARGSARLGSGTQALPAGQKIAEGAAGLTLAKLFSAKEILDAAEVDQELDADGQGMAQRVMVVSSKQLTNLLGTTEIKSVDYNNVKALVQGQVDTFLGFKFIRSERLAKVGTSRMCLAWSRGCVAFGMGMDVKTSIDPLPNKNYSVQVYARESIGAVRVEDEGVVEIACFE